MISELLERIDGAFSDLSEEALDWTPDPALNSITVLIVHSTSALHYWLGEMLGGMDMQAGSQRRIQCQGL